MRTSSGSDRYSRGHVRGRVAYAHVQAALRPKAWAHVLSVDFHTWTLLKGVVLSTLLGVSSELAFTGDGDLVEAMRRSTQDNVSRAGDQITQRNLDIQPTITIRPGAQVRLIVYKDLVLAPWREGRQ